MSEQTPGATDSKSTSNEQLLTFIVNGEEYGVDILRVQEIRGWSAPMPIPNTPAYIKGVINIRGDVVPIADLRERLRLPALSYGDTTVVVVLRIAGTDPGQAEAGAAHERIMGIIVDAMSDVTKIPSKSIKPAPVFAESIEKPLTRGIATMEEKMITILDVDRIFSGTLEVTAARAA